MINIDDDQVAQRLDWPKLTAAIERAVLGGAFAPTRQNHGLTAPDGEQGRLLIMPAWQDDEAIGLKLVTYWPDNDRHDLPTHGASYVLLDARTGHMRAVMSAEALTHRRTAALSLIAASRLLRPEARRLLVIGSGPVSEQILRAHAASGRFETIELFARTASSAEALVARLQADGIACDLARDLEGAVRTADMIASATSALSPFLRGEWLQEQAHVDLFGSFTPAMRESDDRLMARAAEIWTDAPAAADEAGDLVAPLASGAIDRSAISGDFAALLQRPEAPARGITIFKSVGIAVADFAAARLVLAEEG